MYWKRWQAVKKGHYYWEDDVDISRNKREYIVEKPATHYECCFRYKKKEMGNVLEGPFSEGDVSYVLSTEELSSLRDTGNFLLRFVYSSTKEYLIRSWDEVFSDHFRNLSEGMVWRSNSGLTTIRESGNIFDNMYSLNILGFGNYANEVVSRCTKLDDNFNLLDDPKNSSRFGGYTYNFNPLVDELHASPYDDPRCIFPG